MRNATLLQNAVRLQALAAAQGAAAKPRKGLVSGYDPNRYAVKVQLQPEGQETGWISLAAEWIGDGWGMYAPPSIGDMVEVLFDEGSMEAGSTIARFFTDIEQPLVVQSGEFWLVHKNGQSIKLTNDGKLTISDAHGASIALNGDGTVTSAASAWNHTGTLKSSAAIGVNGANPPAQVTGFGTPAGAAVISNFPGSTASLAQCGQAISQLIKDLKAFGLYGA